MLLSEGSQTRGILRGQAILIAWVFKNVFQYVWCMAYFLNILTGSASASWVSSLLLPMMSSRLEGTWACLCLPHHPGLPHWPSLTCELPERLNVHLCLYLKKEEDLGVNTRTVFTLDSVKGYTRRGLGEKSACLVWRGPCTGPSPAILLLHLNFSVHKCFFSLRSRSAADRAVRVEQTATKPKLRRGHRCENEATL